MSERLYDYSDMPGDNDIVCRGSYALGSACGRCQRCLNERESQFADLRASAMAVVDRYDNPPITWAIKSMQPTLGECIEDLRTALTEKEVGHE